MTRDLTEILEWAKDESLVGLETQEPVISSAALEANLTNEAGVNGTNRSLKNVMGLWILQECRRAWGNPKWTDLYLEAENSPKFLCLIDPDDVRFLAPGEDMQHGFEWNGVMVVNPFA